MGTQTSDRLIALGRGQLLGIDVPGWVIHCVVREQAVRARLEQGRPLPGPGGCDRSGSGVEDGEQVVAIDTHPGHPVSRRTIGETDCRGLDRAGGRDGPVVVLDDEQHGRLEHPGEVQRLMEVALRRGAFTAEGGDDGVDALLLETPCEPDRVRELGGQCDRNRQDLGGRSPAVRVPAPEQEGITQWPSLPELHGELTILRHNPVHAWTQRHRHADDARLLPSTRRERAQPALALEVKRLGVNCAGEQHPAERLAELVLGERGDTGLRGLFGGNGLHCLLSPCFGHRTAVLPLWLRSTGTASGSSPRDISALTKRLHGNSLVSCVPWRELESPWVERTRPRWVSNAPAEVERGVPAPARTPDDWA